MDKLSSLEQYHDEYSSEAADIISETKAHMSDGITAYKRCSITIYDWCCNSVNRLHAYLKLIRADKIDSDNLKEQKKLLVEFLKDGASRMETAQAELTNSSKR